MNQEKSEHRWSTIRDEAIDLFAGEVPGAQLEQDIIGHFVDDPERVIRAVHRIAASTSTIGSRWAVLRADLNRTSHADVVASNTASRQKLIDRARTWIQHAGLYHQTWEDCAAELFGDGVMTPELAYLEDLERDTRDRPGRYLYDALLKASITRTAEHGPQEVPPDTSAKLYTLRNDQNARDVLHAEWIKTRPRGIQAEAEHEAWNRTAAKAKETECQTPEKSSTTPSSPSDAPRYPATESPSTTPTPTSETPQSSESPSSHSADDIPHFTPTT